MEVSCEQVLEFWFGAGVGDAEVAQEKAPLWWGGDEQTDRLIGERFARPREAAVNGELPAWETTARGRLALIILVDQFSRNLFRRDPRAFAQDHLARQWCLDGLAAGADRALRPIERVFFYLPLEHSESQVDQARSMELFTALVDAAPPAQRGVFSSFLGYARQHHDIIERFGRFPHRNAVLGRKSTEQELEFLKQPGSSF